MAINTIGIYAALQAERNTFNHDAIDLDKGFFDSIDHDMMTKAVSHYCKNKWVLLQVVLWLKAGVIQQVAAQIHYD